MTLLSRRLLAAAALAVAAGASAAAGLDLHADADAADMGLPVYPGAVKKADLDGDKAGFSFGVWGETFGLKVAVISYRSDDGVDKVVAFYRDALARYGQVIDCSADRAKADRAHHRGDDDDDDEDAPVSCGHDTVKPGGRLFKAGTNRDQRVFKASPWHDGTSFQLLRVEEHDG